MRKFLTCFLSIIVFFVYASKLAESVTFYASCDKIQYQEAGQNEFAISTGHGNKEESGKDEEEALETLRNRLCSFVGTELERCILLDCGIDIEYNDQLIRNGDFDEDTNCWNFGQTTEYHVYEYTRGTRGKCLYINGNGESEFPMSASQDVNVKGKDISITFSIKLSNYGPFKRSVELVLWDLESYEILGNKKITVTPNWNTFSVDGTTRRSDTTVKAGIYYYDEKPDLRIDDASFSAFGRALYKESR